MRDLGGLQADGCLVPLEDARHIAIGQRRREAVRLVGSLGAVRALLGVVAHDASRVNIGVLVTTSTFTFGARELIRSDCRLDGKDYEGIESWLAEYRRLFPNGAH